MPTTRLWCAAVVLVGCAPPRSVADSSGIDSVTTALVKATENKDVAAYVAQHAESVLFEWPGVTLRGRELLRAGVESNWAGREDLSVNIVSAGRHLLGAQAVEFQSYHERWRDSTGRVIHEYGRAVLVLSRDGTAGWKIDRFMGFADSVVQE